MYSPALHTALIDTHADDLRRRTRRASAPAGTSQLIDGSGFLARVIRRLAGRAAGGAAGSAALA